MVIDYWGLTWTDPLMEWRCLFSLQNTVRVDLPNMGSRIT